LVDTQPIFSDSVLLSYGDHPGLHSFPTRRSSDLMPGPVSPIDSTTKSPSTLWRHEVHTPRQPLSHAVSMRTVPTACIASRALMRSEEHTSELQSRENLVCRLLLEKKKMKKV